MFLKLRILILGFEKANADFFKMVLTMPNIRKTAEVKDEKNDIHFFDCFSGDFGDDRDSNKIANNLHDSRLFL